MAKSDFNFKRISDPVHGTIGLSEPEVKVINTQVFQRLRRIRQLGLAYLVYPSADYSRFSHSLGTCYVMGQMLDSLKRKRHRFKLEDVQLYRLAALLHDIGHYPFSHAMEKAVAERYGSGVIRRKNENAGLPSHEILGKRVLNLDAELSDILRKTGFDPGEIASLFLREAPKRMRYANLISSDLDADRIDYMLRTACHTGLPYGSLDINYLLSQMDIDNEGRMIFPEKAIGAVDHFLLSRFFNYKQLSYHKTVCAFEKILGDVLQILLRKELIGCKDSNSLPWIKLTLKNDKKGDWCMLTDSRVDALIADLNTSRVSKEIKAKAISLNKRTPPKEVWRYEKIGPREEDKEIFNDKMKLINNSIAECCDHFGINKSFLIVHEIPGWQLTKADPYVPIDISDDESDKHHEELAQSVYIKPRGRGLKPVLIFKRPNSLMHVMAGYAYYSIRIFLVSTPLDQKLVKDVRKKLEKYMKN